MKEIKTLIVFVLIIILTSVLSSLGFYKLFCTLQQTVDWNAVSAISNIIMIVITGMAVVLAIIIPQKDRIESSKIQLYNQRFELYYLLSKMMHDGSVSKEILQGLSIDDLYKKTLVQASFLVNSEDQVILKELMKYHPTMSFVKQENEKVFFEIRLPIEEVNKLDEVFLKYLSIGGYGLK